MLARPAPFIIVIIFSVLFLSREAPIPALIYGSESAAGVSVKIATARASPAISRSRPEALTRGLLTVSGWLGGGA